MFLIIPGSLIFQLKKINLLLERWRQWLKTSVLPPETFHKYRGRKPAERRAIWETAGKTGGVLRIEFNG